MKLVRFGAKGAEKPGLIDANGQLRDLSGCIADINAAAISPTVLAKLASIDPASLPTVTGEVRFGPCISNVGKFICIGLNFSCHAEETGATVPPEPLVFMKATSSISGPNDPIIKPRGSTKLDWEVELAVVIGQPLSYATEAEAARAIAGYCVCHDVSERAFQLERHGQWTKGKGCDSFGPLGPWLVTTDEIPDPHNLAMWLDVNGVRKQDGSSATMVYRPAFLASYLSQFMSLQPGDVITTGTPAGVGLGRIPPEYLEVGDVVRLGIEGLGSQHQIVVSAE